MENNNLKIIRTDDKTYNLANTEESIDFLIYALNGKYYALFVEFVFGHLGINFYDYLNSLEDKEKNIFVVLNDVSPFFDLIVEDFESNNVFYKYIYSYQSSDLIKKQKINNIIDGLKKTLDYNLDFHNASIFRNMYLEMDNDFYKLAYTREFSSAYIYYCVTYKLMSIYDYIYDKFYSFIEKKNKFDDFYSLKYKEFIKNTPKVKPKMDFDENANWFVIGKDFANGKIFDLYEKGNSFRQIAIELYNKESLRNFISESFSTNPTNLNKAILKDRLRLEKIIEYFESNDLIIDERFKSKYRELT